MNQPERFNQSIEMLLSDRSPAAHARCLDRLEQRMLVLAQRIRGNQTEGPDSGFVETLGCRLSCHGVDLTLPHDS